MREWNNFEDDQSQYDLSGKKVAILATSGFEESELFEPLQALWDANADVDVVSLKNGQIRSWKNNDWGSVIEVDKTIKEASPEDYHALVLPGGVINADRLRADSDIVEFVKAFAESGKPIASICHAAWTLIETGCVSGHQMTSWPSLKTDLENAGADWVDQEVVADHGWISSRKPEDLQAFNKTMIKEFALWKQTPMKMHDASCSVFVGRL